MIGNTIYVTHIVHIFIFNLIQGVPGGM